MIIYMPVTHWYPKNTLMPLIITMQAAIAIIITIIIMITIRMQEG